MSLQDVLDAMRTKFESKLSPEIVDTMHQATDELLQSGIMDRVLKVGNPAPQFSLPDHNGAMVDSADLLGKGPLAVSFYRGTW